MTGTSRASGADLARLVLAAARAAAKTRPAPGPKTRRTARTTRGAAGDPQGLGNVLARLTAEQGWEDGLGGGNLIDQWATIAPTELASTVQPVAYDPDRGILQLRPSSPAYATQVRLFQQQLAKHLNGKLGRPAVRGIRVLTPGGTATAADPTPESAPQPDQALTARRPAPDGYKAARELLLAHRPERQPGNPYIAEAAARQEAALRAHRLPEAEHRDAHWERDRLAAAQADHNETTRRAAIARARHERANGETPRRLFGAA